MEVVVTPEKTKKHKNDLMDLDGTNQTRDASGQEASPSKSLKFTEPFDNDASSSQISQGSETQDSQQSSEKSSQDSASSIDDGGCAEKNSQKSSAETQPQNGQNQELLRQPQRWPIPHPDDWDDMEGLKAPHLEWESFFNGWPEDKIIFYSKSLTNDYFNPNFKYCNFKSCNTKYDNNYNAKHFLCVCEEFKSTLRLERHDAILEKVLNQIHLAIRRKKSYFEKGEEWKVLTHFKNKGFDWPKEINPHVIPKLYPHVVAYSLSPKKRALVAEFSISWEHWLSLEKDKMTKKYLEIKTPLEKMGFEVEFRIIVLGARGVVSPGLCDFFDQILGMDESEISVVHEEISQEIINVPYQSKYYRDFMERTSGNEEP